MKPLSSLPMLSFALVCSLSLTSAQEVAEEAKAKASAPTEVSDFPAELKTRAPKSLEEVKVLEKRVQELVTKIRPATVSIFGGTGVVVNKEGYILTAGHVIVEAGRRVRIRFPDGRRAMAVTLGVDDRYDSGMAKIVSEGDFPYLEMGDSSAMERGEWCLAVGFPVSFSRSEKPPVDSGGPLFDLDGKIIGINSRVSGSLNRNVHVPVDIFKRDWDSLAKSEVYDEAGKLKPPAEKRGYLGVRAGRNATVAAVGQVIDGSAADKAGMKSGDVILEVAGKKTKTFREVVAQLSRKVEGDEIKIKVSRDDKELELKAKLGKRP